LFAKQTNANGIKTRRLSGFSLFSLVYNLIFACLKCHFYANLVVVATSGHAKKMAATPFDPP